jgi:hypothetical protein
MRSYGQYNWVQTGDSDRIDACHIVHGLPVDQLTSIAEMQRQYHGKDFQIRLLHVDPNWAALSDLIASTPTTPTNGHSPTNGAAAGHGPTNGSGAGPNTGGTPVTPSTPPTTPRGRI